MQLFQKGISHFRIRLGINLVFIEDVSQPKWHCILYLQFHDRLVSQWSVVIIIFLKGKVSRPIRDLFIKRDPEIFFLFPYVGGSLASDIDGRAQFAVIVQGIENLFSDLRIFEMTGRDVIQDIFAADLRTSLIDDAVKFFLQFNEDRTASWDVVEDAINYGICFKIINKDNSVIEIPCAEITPDSYNIIDGRVVADFDLILTKACKAYVNGSVEVCYKLYSRASNNPKYRFDKSPYSDPSNSIAYYSFLPVTGITLSPEKPFIHVNNSYYLGKTIQPGNAYYEAVAWSSANDTIVSVNEQGMITGVATGVAEVTATIHDDTTTEPVSATVPVTVYSIATNVADGNNQQTVTDTAGTIIDDIGNSANPNISNTDISSDEIGGIQEQIHEGMERGDPGEGKRHRADRGGA